MNRLYKSTFMSKTWRIIALLCLFVIPPSLELSAQPYTNPTACGLGIALSDNNAPAFDSIPLTVTTSVGTVLGTDVIVTDVNIIIEHTWRSDINLSLLSPSGVVVPLLAGNGGSADDFGDTTGGCGSVLNLNMAAASPISSVAGTPAVGSYIPAGDFVNFNDGSDPNGTWTLLYQDVAASDVGTFQFAEIVFAAPPLTNPTPCAFGQIMSDNNAPGFDLINLSASTTVGTSLGVDVVVSDVNVIIEHTWRSDINLNLISPNGVVVPLLAGNGGSADDFGDIASACSGVLNFNMAAGAPISSIAIGTSIGSFVPEGNLNAFNDGSDPNGTWVLQYQDVAASDIGTFQFAEVVFAAPSCQNPINLNTINITGTTATGVWESQGPGTSFEVEIGLSGFVQGTGTVVPVTDTFVNAASLSPSTAYDWYVREICGPGDESIWSGPSTFQTSCGTVVAPFSENFDNNAIWTGTTAIDPCWALISNDATFEWRADASGTVSGNTGPNDDVTGGGQYMYTEGTGAGVGDTAVLETPFIDVSTLTVPQASFFYHMTDEGFAQMGDLYFDYLDSTTGVWTNLFTQIGQAQALIVDPFIKFSATLPGSSSVVKFRWRGYYGTGFRTDMAIDEFEIAEAPVNELAIVSLDVVTAGCALGTNETVAMTIVNAGSGSQSGFPVTYQVDAQTAVTETVAGTINSGDTLVYTFTGGADLSAFGIYSVVGFVDLSNDEDRSNDTTGVSGVNAPLVSSFPYNEDFESGAGDWLDGGVANSWQLGTPANTLINSAASGANAWVTNLTGLHNPNEASTVTSPCFDFTGLVAPGVTMNIQRQASNSNDGAALQVSTDAGLTWTNVGANGDPNNWYNDATIIGLAPFGNQEGWTGEIDSAWVAASNLINTTGGLNNVKLRVVFGSNGTTNREGFGFDDVGVVETALVNDLSVVSVDNLSSGCGLSSTSTIAATVVNTGINAQTGFDMSFVVNGGTAVTETVAASINGGDTLVYTFTATADLSASTTYDIDVYHSLATDTDNSNDTASASVESFEIPVLTTNSVTICSPQNVTLLASASIGEISWTDSSGAVVAIGDSLNLGLVTSDQSYVVEAVTGAQDTISTTFANNNGAAGNMFDVTPVDNIIIDSIDIHTAATTSVDVEVYTRVGTYVGNTTSPAGWTLVGTATVIGQGAGNPTKVNIGGISLPGGQVTGMYVTLVTGTLAYTGTGTTAPTQFSNADMVIDLGQGGGYPFNLTFSPRAWNGRLYYSKPGCTSGPQLVDVNIGSAPNTSFTFSQTAAFTLSFTETISPTPDSVAWDFGDGNSSTASNPSHDYTVAGSFTVTLTAYLDGCDTTIGNAVFVNSLNDALSSNVNLYPNPTKGNVVIQSNNITFNSIEVMDMLGNIVYREDAKFNTEKVINLGDLTSGNYLIRLISDDGVAVKRVMLSK